MTRLEGGGGGRGGDEEEEEEEEEEEGNDNGHNSSAAATTYGPAHRAFLQALLSRQTITYSEAKPVLAAIQTALTPGRATLAEDVTAEEFEDYMQALHAAISPFDLEIRSGYEQQPRRRGGGRKERVYALVNTTGDALAQLATCFSPDEIAFVKRLLDCIFVTYNTRRAEVLAVTNFQALKVAKPPPPRGGGGDDNQAAAAANGLTLAQAESVLESMVAQGWFELSEAGFYSCSQRTLMELSVWLHETYNDDDDDDEEENDEEEDEEEEEGRHQKIKSCAACRDIVTVGQRCSNRACSTRLHLHCVRNFFRAQRDGDRCPRCQTTWHEPLPVGEEAATNAGSRRRTTTRESTTARRSSGARVNGSWGEEESDASGGAEA